MNMFSSVMVAILGVSPAIASVLSSRAVPNNTLPSGTNPIKVSSAQFLGNLTADNSCSHRDLGFSGPINGVWYHIFGDTIWCDTGVTDPNLDPGYGPDGVPGGFVPFVRDSISQSTSNPLKVHDLHLNDNTPVPHQNQFVPYDKSFGEAVDTGFGGTSLCETNATAGEAAFFYLVAPNGAPSKGAGVARISTAFGTPTVEARFGSQGYWWDAKTSPRYGDQAAYRDTQGDYIYAWGGAPLSATGEATRYVYQTRVLATQAFDLTKYQYWYGRATGWKTTPLTTFNEETAVMAGAGQGQVVYSNYYKTYLFVHTDLFHVLIRTAPKPEGPWSADVIAWTPTKFYSAGYIYAGVAHPYLDTSGKTLTVSYTNNPNVNDVVKITFA
ncbi:hypothetical protein BT63DRAFT_404016 [Microthyrium microscopicum]|uniref:Uncharacterized protein n=1 Tax=Microthyrium microscopicum TaxID=703497 RepID=A0A6A6U3U1_9PEZI|nr:hypothetical protein BT63DRAFT_404016 [Microthyrium microscopicum]